MTDTRSMGCDTLSTVEVVTREQFRAIPDYLPGNDTAAKWNLHELIRWVGSYEDATTNGLRLLIRYPEEHAFVVQKRTVRVLPNGRTPS